MRAAALLAAGAVAGGATAVSLSANAVEGEDSTTGAASAEARPGGDHGGPGGHGRGFGADTAELAESLGVTEEKLEAALEAVRKDLAPDEKPADGEERTPPTEEDRAARTAAFAKALADELGIAESKVTAALESIRSADAAERRTELGERLDQAIEDGKLTAADKTSVLKAYDAGVLGGPR
ncbi:hypothetical protein E7Z54_16615 [Nocardioides sp.]|nr:hypothetical protein E7Z54_16615 [Nocardioides sp.]